MVMICILYNLFLSHHSSHYVCILCISTGSKVGNFLDGMFPSAKLYYTREEVKRDALSSPDSVVEDEGYFEEAKTKLLA